ncbi:hypothetical protein KUCAC02_008890, partial [Chaenocephalus aceratus]
KPSRDPSLEPAEVETFETQKPAAYSLQAAADLICSPDQPRSTRPDPIPAGPQTSPIHPSKPGSMLPRSGPEQPEEPPEPPPADPA